jgi:hypothetical protein
VPHSSLSTGRFGRILRRLPPFALADQDLEQLARTMIREKEEDLGPEQPAPPVPGDNADIPASFTQYADGPAESERGLASA